MHRQIQCFCGRTIEVSIAQARSRIQCRCTRHVTVPLLEPLSQATAGGRVAEASVLATLAARTQASEEPLEIVVLLTPEEIQQERISENVLSHFVAAVDRTVKKRLEVAPAKVDLLLGVAILPQSRLVLDLQCSPAISELMGGLEADLQGLAVPDVLSGPVVLAVRRSVRTSGPLPLFHTPFEPIGAGRVGLYDEVLPRVADGGSAEKLDAAAEPAASWLSRFIGQQKRNFRRLWDQFRTGWQSSRGQPAPYSSVKKPSPTEIARRALRHGNVTLESITSQIEKDPKQPILYAIRAELLMAEDDYAAGIADGQRLLELSGDDLSGRCLLARLYWLSGSREQALAEFGKVLAACPDQYEALFFRGLLYMDLEAWDAAVADFTAAHEAQECREPAVLVRRARALARAGRDEAALADCDEALRLDPHDIDARLMRAHLRTQLLNTDGPNDLTSIVADWDAAIAVDSRQPYFYVSRGYVHMNRGDMAAALADADRALEIDSAWPAAHGLRGICQELHNEYDAAIDSCTRALSGGENSPNVYVARARAYRDQGDLPLALADCDAALALDAEHAGAYNTRGLIELDRDSAETAIGDFDAAARLRPAWAAPCLNRGNARRKLGQFDEALCDYDECLKRDENEVFAWLNRGLTWQDLGCADRALADFDKAIELAPQIPPGWLSRGLTRLSEEDFIAGLADIERAIELDPDNSEARLYRARGQRALEHYDAALVDYNWLVGDDPQPSVLCERAQLWLQLENAEAAAADFQAAGEADPEHADEIKGLWLLHEATYENRRHNYDAAIDKAAEAIALDDRNGSAYLVRAGACWYSGRLVEAVDDYTWLIENGGACFAVFNGRGQVYAELGEFELALYDLARAIQLAQNETDAAVAFAYNGRALAYSGLGKYDEASEDFERSIQACPDNAWVHYNHALMYDRLGKRKEARSCFQLALAVTNPALTPRKRSRAEAYLKRMDNPAPAPDAAAAQASDELVLDSPSVIEARANYQHRNREFAAAVDSFTRLIELDASSAAAYYGRAQAQFGQNNFDAALTDVCEAIRLRPDVLAGYFFRAQVYDKLGRTEDALADLSETVDREPEQMACYLTRATGYGRHGMWREAQDDMEMALELTPESCWPSNNLAWMLATCPDDSMRDAERALEQSRAACRLCRWKEPECLSTLAAAYAEAGNFTEAVRWETIASEKFFDKRRDRSLLRVEQFKRGEACRWTPQLDEA